MSKFKLIYFEGCPNSKNARAILLSCGVEFEVVVQDDLEKESSLQDYSSPSILFNDEIIFGQKLSPGASACSAGQFDEELIKTKIKKLSDSSPLPSKKSFASFGSFGSALTVGLCPVCIPAIGAFLSSLGLGFVVNESVLKPLLIIFLIFAIGGFLWSYFEEHGNIWPLVLGIGFGSALYIGRYTYISGPVNSFLMYGGIVGIILVSIWNMRLKKLENCQLCEVKK